MTDYIAVDPGGTAGVALSINGRPPLTWELEPMEALELVESMLSRSATVVCESFVPRPGVRTWQPDAIEMIGALRYMCRRHDVPFRLQSPASAKAFGTNDKLKRVGWRPLGDHARDAMRHLLLALTADGVIDPSELMEE